VSSARKEIQTENRYLPNEQLIEQAVKDESRTLLGGKHYPWRRFFARSVDLMSSGFLIFLLFSFLIGYLFPQNSEGFIKIINNPIGAGILLYVLWLPIEALFLSLGGTTPAKWVFGIHVESQSGGKLSYGQAFKRAILVFVQGDGFGIPLIIFITRLLPILSLQKLVLHYGTHQ
jgi:uncharacterized RDD family membrane protein YckC